MKSVLYLGCPAGERDEAERLLRAAHVSVVWADNVAYALDELRQRDMPVLLDLFTVKFLLAYGTRPAHLFGRMGLLSGGAGFVVLAYLSDMTLLDAALFAHGTSIFDQSLQVASVDHAMWFHRPCKLDDWLLYTQDSPSASGARGMTRGSLFTRSGVLIASVAQEGLIRALDD